MEWSVWITITQQSTIHQRFDKSQRATCSEFHIPQEGSCTEECVRTAAQVFEKHPEMCGCLGINKSSKS